MLLLGRVPHTADVAEWQGWRFEIVDMDKHRIDKVLALRLPEKSPLTRSNQGRSDQSSALIVLSALLRGGESITIDLVASDLRCEARGYGEIFSARGINDCA